jgi:hypothetical protein
LGGKEGWVRIRKSFEYRRKSPPSVYSLHCLICNKIMDKVMTGIQAIRKVGKRLCEGDVALPYAKAKNAISSMVV